MSTNSDLEATFRNVLAALNCGDAEGVADYFTEDGVVVDYSNPGVVHKGRAAVATVVREYLDAIPGIQTEIVDLVAGEDRLAAELRLTAPSRDDTETFEARCCTYYTFRDGLLESEHVYFGSGDFPELGS